MASHHKLYSGFLLLPVVSPISYLNYNTRIRSSLKSDYRSSLRNSHYLPIRLSDYGSRRFMSNNYWNPWSSWSSCGSNCVGALTKQRFRTCKYSNVCQGSPVESLKCETQPSFCPYWSAWAEWSETSASCGKIRNRTCEKVLNQGSVDCIGDSVQTIGCWSDWSSCDFENSCNVFSKRINLNKKETKAETCFKNNLNQVIEKSSNLFFTNKGCRFD